MVRQVFVATALIAAMSSAVALAATGQMTGHSMSPHAMASPCAKPTAGSMASHSMSGGHSMSNSHMAASPCPSHAPKPKATSHP